MSRDNIGRRNSESKERELERIRHEWMLEQERAREHERRKQKMIREYEEKRARELSLKNRNRRSSKRNHSRSRSHSPSTSTLRTRATDSESQSTRNLVMSQKLETSSSNTRLFKGPEGTKIHISDLKKIKVDIQREIGLTEKTSELQRNITNPDDIVLKRREGEGAKPIFEREELKESKQTDVNEEVPERRTIVTVNSATSSRRRTVSLSPERRHRNRSPRHDSRYETSSRSRRETADRDSHKNSDTYSSRDRNREVRRDRRNARERLSLEKSSREYTRHRSHSRDDDRHKFRRDSSTSHHDRRSTLSRYYEDDRLRNRRMEIPPHHYLEPMPVPFFYGNYARPIIVDPMMGLRGPMAMGRGRMPMMGPVRPPYPPRFVPPVIFRPHGPHNPRY